MEILYFHRITRRWHLSRSPSGAGDNLSVTLSWTGSLCNLWYQIWNNLCVWQSMATRCILKFDMKLVAYLSGLFADIKPTCALRHCYNIFADDGRDSENSDNETSDEWLYRKSTLAILMKEKLFGSLYDKTNGCWYLGGGVNTSCSRNSIISVIPSIDVYTKD